MKICLLGTGYVGLVSAVCFAELGHRVVGVDIDNKKIKKLKEGISPIYEPGLEEMLQKNLKSGRLTFTDNISEGIEGAKVVFNAVGTPPDEQRRVDLRYVREVAKQVGEELTDYLVFVNKSTVPVGTAEEVKRIINENLSSGAEFDVASNPEFLREGSAVEDFMNPDRIIIGVDSKKAEETLRELYKPITKKGFKLMVTDIKSAELIKYASNAFLAAKVTFINEVANLCDEVGADVREVAKGMGLDKRIGDRFLEAGPGYGGSCFPKDVDEFIRTSSDYGIEIRVLEAVSKANRFQRSVVLQKLKKHLPEIANKKVAVWGLAFKPDTDDIRESSAIEIVKRLIEKGAKVRCYDPIAMENAKEELKNKKNSITFVSKKEEALKGADALILMTQWEEFKDFTPKEIRKHLNIVIDTRNIWERKEFEEEGITYEGMGR